MVVLISHPCVVYLFGTHKKVIHLHLGLHDAAMAVLFDAIGDDHDQLQRLARLGGFTEHLHFLSKGVLIRFVDDKFTHREVKM